MEPSLLEHPGWLFAAAILALLSVILAGGLWRRRRELEAVRAELGGLEDRYRRLDDDARRLREERDELTRQFSESKASLEALRQRFDGVERAKAEADRKTSALEEEKQKLERHQADLEERVRAARAEREALETRVVSFQGQWYQQLRTLEEEVATLLRQLGEFQKATRFPLADESDESSEQASS